MISYIFYFVYHSETNYKFVCAEIEYLDNSLKMLI